jgi:hypothetical protein
MDFDDVVDNSHPVVLDENYCLAVVENNIHLVHVQDKNHRVRSVVVDRVVVGTIVVVGMVVVVVVDTIVANPLNDE